MTSINITPTAFNVNIASIVIYNRKLSDIERKEVESYLAKRYDINSDL